MTSGAPPVAGFAGGAWHETGPWQCCAADPGRAAPPLDAAWESVPVPGVVSETRAAASMPRDDIEQRDWWFRTAVPAADAAGWLVFEGVATIAEVFVDGAVSARSANAFVPFAVPLEPRPDGGDTEVLLCCRALERAAVPARPRARWRTRLVVDNAVRWHRTPLAGRMPGWWSGPPVVGPWRPVRRLAGGHLRDVHLQATVTGEGVPALRFAASVRGMPGPTAATLVVGGHRVSLTLQGTGDDVGLAGQGELPGLALWWPHTHGTPVLHDAAVECTNADGTTSRVPLAPVGFRTVAWDAGTGTLTVNGVRVFARGACWTVFDPRRAADDTAARASAVGQVVAGGLNIVRVTGCFPYVDAATLEAFDRAGVMVWHDVALASMDYPFADAAFAEGLSHEIAVHARRWAAHACVVVAGGGSEVGQQPAMLGMPPETWQSPFLLDVVPRVLAAAAPGLPWVPYVPGGGADLPFRADAPVSHYFGVGAYRRGVDDIRRSGVRFAAECLAFSHVPDERTLLESVAHPAAFRHDSGWRAGMPRDNAVAWDFGDVRDHYLEQRYGVHAQRLRTDDPERYLALSRSVSGEVVSAALAEMRRPGGATGAVLWWLRDMVPGDGWGLIDAAGRVKPAWWHVRRALQPVAVLVTDEGLNGLLVHVVNDAPTALSTTLEVRRVRHDRVVELGATDLVVAPHEAQTVGAEAVLGGFRDLTWAYRFGPAGHDAVQVRLLDRSGERMADAWHWVSPPPAAASREVPALTAEAVADAHGLVVTLSASDLERGIVVEADGCTADDAWFDLAPGERRRVRLRRGGERAAAGAGGLVTVRSLGARGTLTVTAASS